MLKQISSVAIISALAACSSICPTNVAPKKHAKPTHAQNVVVYQTYENNADANRISATMYTRSSRGGESKMGKIKFVDTDNGLKMETDLRDMRPGVVYNVKLYECAICDNIKLPQIQSHTGKLNETYMLQGVSAGHLSGAKIHLERDGGYKAGWGTLGKTTY